MSAGSHTTKETIERKMRAALAATHVDIVDESWKHAGHAGARAGGGHFVLRVVSAKFDGVSLLDRNRMVFGALAEEMGTAIHALVIKALTPREWETGQ